MTKRELGSLCVCVLVYTYIQTEREHEKVMREQWIDIYIYIYTSSLMQDERVGKQRGREGGRLGM